MTQSSDSESARIAADTRAPGVSGSQAPSNPNASTDVVKPQSREFEEPSLNSNLDHVSDLSVSQRVRLAAIDDRDLPKPKWVALAIAIAVLGVGLDQNILTWVGVLMTLFYALQLTWPTWRSLFSLLESEPQLLALISFLVVGLGALQLSGALDEVRRWTHTPNWDAIGALGDGLGALGQIFIAMIALWVAWRQYVIEKDLTTRQNIITQQQTIDTYFQGVSDLVIDEEGLLEDWPQERAIAEGRTAAILASVDGQGKAKILRFLSHSGLLTPLKRDRRLGRAILDGAGGYLEDRNYGIRVIDLRGMLADSDLSFSDLRWLDLSDANLVTSNLSHCDLVRSNLSRTILYQANLEGANLEAVRLFYGELDEASPRSRTEPPNYQTGAYTGAVVEGVDFSDVENLSDEQRYYCCAWGGAKARKTIPGGCEGIPNKLGR
jgi:uncharacterized protein YjbI with pentapeptide repeats